MPSLLQGTSEHNIALGTLNILLIKTCRDTDLTEYQGSEVSPDRRQSDANICRITDVSSTGPSDSLSLKDLPLAQGPRLGGGSPTASNNSLSIILIHNIDNVTIYGMIHSPHMRH